MEDIEKAIKNIQEKLYNDPNTDNKVFLSYTKVGFVEIVELVINTDTVNVTSPFWHSENNSLEWDEVEHKYEDFESFLLRRLEDCITSFNLIKMALNENKI